MYEKKKKLYFHLIFIVFIVLIGSIISVLLTKLTFDLKLTIITVLLLFSLILLLPFKAKFDFYTMITNYNKLLQFKNDKTKTSLELYTKNWYSQIQKESFKNFRSLNDFDLFYKFEYVGVKSKKRKAAIILVIIKTDISYEDNSIVKAIHDFEDKFFKEEKFVHHIILQFKKTDILTEKGIETTENILFTKQNKNHYIILINALYSTTSKEIFYIHSNDYSPNHFYTFAVEEIKKII